MSSQKRLLGKGVGSLTTDGNSTLVNESYEAKVPGSYFTSVLKLEAGVYIVKPSIPATWHRRHTNTAARALFISREYKR